MSQPSRGYGSQAEQLRQQRAQGRQGQGQGQGNEKTWSQVALQNGLGPMPADRLIKASMSQAVHKAQGSHVRAYKYRIKEVVTSEQEANEWMEAVCVAERARLGRGGGTIVEHKDKTMDTVGRPEVWKEHAWQVGIECHRLWTGFSEDNAPLVTDRGQGTATLGQERRDYLFEPAPLLRRRGFKMEGAVWGSEEHGATFEQRESWATNLVVGVLAEAEVRNQEQAAVLPPVECRSLVMSGQGHIQGKRAHAMVVCVAHEHYKRQVLASGPQLVNRGLELVTEAEYKERWASWQGSQNQESDSQEVEVDGRKFMLWNVPKTLTGAQLQEHCSSFFQDWLQECRVTTSAKNTPYAWYTLDSATADRVDKAWVFEHRLQSRSGWGQVRQSLSLARAARIEKGEGLRQARIDREDIANGKAPRVVTAGAAPGSVEEAQYMGRMADMLVIKLADPAVAGAVAEALQAPLIRALEERVPAALAEATAPRLVELVDKQLKAHLQVHAGVVEQMARDMKHQLQVTEKHLLRLVDKLASQQLAAQEERAAVYSRTTAEMVVASQREALGEHLDEAVAAALERQQAALVATERLETVLSPRVAEEWAQESAESFRHRNSGSGGSWEEGQVGEPEASDEMDLDTADRLSGRKRMQEVLQETMVVPEGSWSGGLPEQIQSGPPPAAGEVDGAGAESGGGGRMRMSELGADFC